MPSGGDLHGHRFLQLFNEAQFRLRNLRFPQTALSH